MLLGVHVMKIISYGILIGLCFGIYNIRATNFAYVGDYSNNTVSIIDLNSNTVTGLVSDPDHTFSEVYYIVFTPDGSKAYVSNYPGTISIIDTATNTVTGLVQDPDHTVTFPYSMNITPDGKKVYVMNYDFSTISVIDVATDSVIGVVQDPDSTFQSNYFMAITPDGTKGYVANYGNGSVSIVDIATDTVTGVVTDPSTTFHGPFPLSLTPDGTKLYVGNYGNNTMSIVDVPTDTVTGLVSDPDHTFGNIYWITITPDGTKAYVDNFVGSNNTFSVVDLTTNTVTGVITDPSFDDTYYLAMDANGKFAYAANYDASTVSIIDVATNTVTGLVSDPDSRLQGAYPIAIAYTLHAPNAPAGCQTQNIFLTQTDVINVITWSPPATGSAPVSYRVYRDAALTDLAATLPASGPLLFMDHNRFAGVIYTYYIVAVDSNNNASDPASISVTQNC